ncbi:bifunctional tetrahydrofolate synthase/dihydrofolate synthase [Permianibacter sp. IMCC34836]|uniref:bifunctional tetrahydrofolate synthase/dihydrofolate synthase n=1 Tax=Permianibacter fluminis TaxID=2738515 RepID=UPI0015563538|nr:bifunctional tetrahydrofolate synthase/dihydrofolate synthase [Permianibacter fluminis]NQD37535.1 bifunctional tetrahydrofolate synthase/dihydrofolate synthase [Permianibacter fluminis]
MTPATLADWLTLLEQRHPVAIDLGLDRVGVVADRLAARQFSCPVITVAGTNGKGSTVATLEALARAHGLSVGVYSSPHLLRFNERVRIDAADVSDPQLLQAFAAVEAARGDVSLTYFEFTTLAALWLFKQTALDLLVLEVGMGGRLDAVNLVDADVAVITTIDFDHMSFLGTTLAAIAGEKAGICRAGKPVVLADPHRFDVMLTAVQQRAALPVRADHDFGQCSIDGQWTFRWRDDAPLQLPTPNLGPDLVAAALAAFRLALPQHWQPEAIARAVADARLAGRWQRMPGSPPTILDIGHNGQASQRLAQRASQELSGRLHIVLGVLGDKDRVALLQPWRNFSSAGRSGTAQALPPRWYLADLDGPRAGKASDLRAALPSEADARCFADPVAAWQTARADAAAGDSILVFGSFLTVAAVLTAAGANAATARS